MLIHVQYVRRYNSYWSTHYDQCFLNALCTENLGCVVYGSLSQSGIYKDEVH